jgi:4-carboxymuconolactone decarboxylase
LARFQALDVQQLTPAQKALHDAVIGTRKKLGGPFSVLLRNPPLGDAFNRVVRALREEGKLDNRLYELIVLLVVRHWSAAYAWSVHVAPALAAGLSQETVDAILARRKPALTKSDETAVYQSVTELMETKRLSEPSYQRLISEFGFDLTLDIIATVGLYCMVSTVINGFEVPTPNGETPFQPGS